MENHYPKSEAPARPTEKSLTDPETRFNKLVAKLQSRNYRLTPQRMALLRLLATSEGHPSASQLYDQIKAQFPTTSLATVYKTLNVLKEMGEVLELGFRNDDNRYDGNKPYPHPHLICSNCGRILDLDLELVRPLLGHVAELSGYQITGHQLDFYGLCTDCQRNDPRG
jgi:Fur family transcriptional regulator, peroxide stress response regulator